MAAQAAACSTQQAIAEEPAAAEVAGAPMEQEPPIAEGHAAAAEVAVVPTEQELQIAQEPAAAEVAGAPMEQEHPIAEEPAVLAEVAEAPMVQEPPIAEEPAVLPEVVVHPMEQEPPIVAEPAAVAEVVVVPTEQEPPIVAAPAAVAVRPREQERPITARVHHGTLRDLKISDLLVGYWLQWCIKPEVVDVPLRPLIKENEEIANLLRVGALAAETEKDRAVLLNALGESEAEALAVLEATDPDFGALAAVGRQTLRETLLGHLPISLRRKIAAS